jgi:hypothetical protein
VRRRLALTSALLFTTLTATTALATVPAATAAPLPRSATGSAPAHADPRCQAAIGLAIDRNHQAIALVDGGDFLGAARANELTMTDITRAADVCPADVHSLLERAHHLARQAYEANSAGGATGVQQVQYDIDLVLRDALGRVG